ncbi:MAG TPA: hypothetical protein VHV80_07680, partial [Steroidobacteraceae bacterium]|nr:hypothetical protein [Steroidobacteraceae bacterium]
EEGFPVIAPVAALSDSPDGRDPLLSDHLYGDVPPLAARVAEYAFPTVPAGRLAVVMAKAAGAEGGAGSDGELPEGGSLPDRLVPVELPPQPARASAIIAIGTSRVVVILHCFIVPTPLRRRLGGVTDRDKHQLCPARQRER